MTATAEVRKYNRIHTGKRRAEIKKRILLFAVITLLFVSLGVLFGSSLSAAAKSNAANSRTAFKYYTSIQVEAGDSLWSIAEKYASPEFDTRESYIEEIAALNSLSDKTIHAGEYLTVPYYSYDYK